MSVTVTKDTVAQTLRRLRGLSDKKVLVGIPSTTAERQPDPGETDTAPLNNAEIGYLMETGVPEKNIPARPFLGPGVASVNDQVAPCYKAGAKAVLDGEQPDLDRTHQQVGLIAQGAVQQKITDGPFAPLKPSTLANRRRLGHTGDKPLKFSGQLRRAVTFVLRPKGG